MKTLLSSMLLAYSRIARTPLAALAVFILGVVQVAPAIATTPLIQGGVSMGSLDVPLTTGVGKQILIIDSTVPDRQVLLHGLGSSADVFIINDKQDGLQQIANALKDQKGIDAIHIVSHGERGRLMLGATLIDRGTLDRDSNFLSMIGRALSPEGDIRLYGCNVAAGVEGQAFITELAEKTGADIAASTNTTGAKTLGGDWVLEAKTGTVTDIDLWSGRENEYRYILAASQNFDGETLAKSGSTTATYGDFTFSADGSANIAIVDTYLATSMGSDNALRFDGDFKHDLTTNSIYTTDGSEFKLDSFVISVQGDELLTITGKQNGRVVHTANLDFTQASSSDGGATFTGFGGNAYVGTLTFSGWDYIDEVVITLNQTPEWYLDNDMDDLVVSAAVTPNVAPTITGQAALTMPMDNSITITLGDLTVIDPDNSYPTGFSLTLYSGPNYSLSGNIVTPAPGYIGNLTVPVTVNDGALDSNVFNLLVTVTDPSDIDGDGMPNDWETANALDPQDPSDANLDLDGDGLTNLQEYQAGKDPSVDDNPPVVTAPADVTADSTGLFTAVSLGTATADDAKDGALTPTPDVSYFAPGTHTVTWSATDAAGNIGTATQTVNVNPQVSFDKDQVTAEGATVTFRVILNGPAVSYPVTVPYKVGGTATSGSDHNLLNGDIIISSGTEASVSFNTFTDGLVEGTESVLITMGTLTNAVPGAHNVDTIDIVETNVPPAVSLSADQGAGSTHTIVVGDGPVTVSSTVTDPNTGDTHSYDWTGTDNALTDTDGASDTFTFDPSALSPGFYILQLSISDGTAASDTELTMNVLATAPTLSSTNDSDGDGITDVVEGYGDADGDGIADYTDAIDSSNVLQEIRGQIDSFLIETEPGLQLNLGNVAFRSGLSQAKVSMSDIVTYGGVVADSGYQYSGGLFDFIVDGLPLAGQSVQVVIPQMAAIPANAVYRKVVGNPWRNFVENTNNSFASAPGAKGYCPPPGDSVYTAGLTEGNWCVQLTIQDGGPNDADGAANNSVADPGGVASIQNSGTLRVSSGGGSGSPWLLVMLGVLLWRTKLAQRETDK